LFPGGGSPISRTDEQREILWLSTSATGGDDLLDPRNIDEACTLPTATGMLQMRDHGVDSAGILHVVGELLGQVFAKRRGSRRDFVDEFLPAVDEGNDVLEVRAREIVAPPRPEKASSFVASRFAGARTLISAPDGRCRLIASASDSRCHRFSNPSIDASAGMASSCRSP